MYDLIFIISIQLITFINIKYAQSQIIAGIGPFLEESRYEECLRTLNLADLYNDSNRRVDKNEYVNFVRMYSSNVVTAASYSDLSKGYSLGFISIFNAYACNPTCTSNVFDSNHKECCDGDVMYISIQEFIDTDLFQFCAFIDQYIRDYASTLSEFPSTEPSITPTISLIPSKNPSQTPSISPSLSPSISVSPTAAGQIKLGFSYVIRTNKYYDAEMIFSKTENNTISEVLVNATTDVLKSVLEGKRSCPLGSSQGSQQENHYYRASTPVLITSILDIPCPDEDSNYLELTNCMLIRSVMTIYCHDQIQYCSTFSKRVLNNVQILFDNGCFFRLIDAYYQ